MTNLNLIILIEKLLEDRKNSQRTLEEYLLAFWSLAIQYKNNNPISHGKFLKLLNLAFIVQIPLFKDEWRNKQFNKYSSEENNFLVFETTLLKQIVDLREMDEANLLTNELRYYGLDSPRGSRWYNFDPLTYLECATAGYFDDRQDVTEISWKEIGEFLWCGRIYE